MILRSRTTCALWTALGLCLWIGTPALGASVSLGAATITSAPCSTAGNSGDRSCSASTSGTTILAQSSADHGFTSNPTAIADITVNAQIPYTVTRTVTIAEPPGPLNNTATYETFSVNFSFSYDHNTAYDNTQVGGGFAQAQAFSASVSSSSGFFAGVSWGGSVVGGQNSSSEKGASLNQTNGRSFTVTLDFSGPGVGEIGPADTLPTDFRSWNDTFKPIHPSTGQDGFVHTQSISDTLLISFRLRTESRPAGSVSTTGGEAIACAGQKSPLGGFALDDALDCGSGFTTTASLSGQGTAVVALAEPGIAALLGMGLAGLALAGRRRRR